MRIFLVLGAKSDTPKMCKQMDVFAFSHKAQNFLKARCARLGPWHLLPPPAELSRAPPAVHVKAVADSALRCTGLSLGCVYGSSAASTSAVQLEQPQASTRARAERGASAFAGLVAGCNSLCGILPVTVPALLPYFLPISLK